MNDQYSYFLQVTSEVFQYLKLELQEKSYLSIQIVLKWICYNKIKINYSIQ